MKTAVSSDGDGDRLMVAMSAGPGSPNANASDEAVALLA